MSDPSSCSYFGFRPHFTHSVSSLGIWVSVISSIDLPGRLSLSVYLPVKFSHKFCHLLGSKHLAKPHLFSFRSHDLLFSSCKMWGFRVRRYGLPQHEYQHWRWEIDWIIWYFLIWFLICRCCSWFMVGRFNNYRLVSSSFQFLGNFNILRSNRNFERFC